MPGTAYKHLVRGGPRSIIRIVCSPCPGTRKYRVNPRFVLIAGVAALRVQMNGTINKTIKSLPAGGCGFVSASFLHRLRADMPTFPVNKFDGFSPVAFHTGCISAKRDYMNKLSLPCVLSAMKMDPCR